MRKLYLLHKITISFFLALLPIADVFSSTPSAIQIEGKISYKNKKDDTTIILDDKIINNVKIYPIPVQTDINISFSLTKDTPVTIQIMDVLGNEMSILLSQKLSSGAHKYVFNLSSQLNGGYYFLKIIASNEVIMKRISIL